MSAWIPALAWFAAFGLLAGAWVAPPRHRARWWLVALGFPVFAVGLVGGVADSFFAMPTTGPPPYQPPGGAPFLPLALLLGTLLLLLATLGTRWTLQRLEPT